MPVKCGGPWNGLDEAIKATNDPAMNVGPQSDFTRVSARLKEHEGRLRDFTHQTGLVRQREREQVLGFGRSQASKAVWENRKLRDVNLQALPITQKSLDSVKAFECNLLNSEQQKKLQNEHRKLLIRAAGKPAGTEAGATFTVSMRPLHQMTGKDAAAHIRIPDEPLPYIAIHSHPSGNTFSENDLINFAHRDNMKMLTAVGNNGRVYAVEKTNDFSRGRFEELKFSIQNSHPDYTSSPELYIRYVEDLLKEAVHCGVRYYTK